MIYFELLLSKDGNMLLPHILTFSVVFFSVTLTTSTIIQIKVKALGNNNIKIVFK